MRKNVRSKYRPEFSGDYLFDYKDAQTLSRFVSEGGKITPARISTDGTVNDVVPALGKREPS